MHTRHLARTAASVAAILLLPAAVRSDATRIVDNADSYIDRLGDQETWTIGNAGIEFTVALNRDRTLQPVHLMATGIQEDWVAGAGADPVVTIGGSQRTLNGRAFTFDGVDAVQRGSGVELVARYHATDLHAAVSRHFACFPGAPVIETWTEYTAQDDRTITLANLPGFDLLLRQGTLRWVTGLQTSADDGGSFTLKETDLDNGASLQLGSSGRATEQAMPWFTLDAADDEFFGGVLWHGSWRLDVSRASGAIHAAMGMPPFSTTTAATVETPHAYFGVTGGSTKEASEGTRAFIMASIRQGRPYQPLVTYNTWFTYGTAVDEDAMRQEIQSAADLGVELFVLDAGWYPASPDPTDYTTGIGVWEADPDRFPSGLGALSDLAHSYGMRFGLWVEPERVDLKTVGRPGLVKEHWLAMSNGAYDPGTPNGQATYAQVCLASPEAQQWIVDRLSRLIDEAHPDYLKWDNNYWLNCDREGHGHGADEGNYAHNVGLRSVLAQLRQRYPDLMIENCSGGGNRLEPGMLAWSDTAWMDDHSSIAPHVRHNLEGLSVVMPPPVLLSFVFGGEWDGDQRGDLSLAFRSRMPGMLGATWHGADLSDADRAGIRQEVAIYKEIRDTLADSSAQLLTPQVSDGGQGNWDVLQETSTATGQSVVFAFENTGSGSRITVHPRALRPEVLYDVFSVDTGSLGEDTGAELAASGIEIDSSPRSRGHVLELRPVVDVSSAK